MTDAIVGEVRAAFGLELTALEPVGHGADDAAQLWRGRADDGTDVAVKLSGGGSAAGLLVPAELAGQGIHGVAGPLPTLDGRLWADLEGRRLSVVPWLSDRRALAGDMGQSHWTSYGRVLRHLHDSRVSPEVAAVVPQEQHRHAAVAAAVGQVAEAVAAVSGRTASPIDALAGQLAAVWGEAAPALRHLLDAADLLARDLQGRAADEVVCHGDPHLGNVLLADDGGIWLIDWDDTVLAPRERDLMFVTVGVLAFAPVTADQRSWFCDGYGPVDLDPARLAYYLAVRALDDITGFAAEVLDVARPTDERSFAQSVVVGLVSATGLVTLAREAVRDLAN